MMWYSLNAVFWGVVFTAFVQIISAECGGKTSINGPLNGTITLDSLTYLPNTHCEWLIKAPQPGQTILLTFKQFDTECSFDYLKIYDGSSKQKLLGVFSGNRIPESLVSNTSSVIVEFFSDNNYVRAGCIIDFVITDCQGNCSGHGNCVENQCHCDEMFTGEACDMKICPELCYNATGNGQCSQSEGCQCDVGFIGQSCSFPLNDDVEAGKWHLISDSSPVFKNRFAHAAVYVDNIVWIFGGSNLNEILGDLVKFNIEENVWQLVQPKGDRPVARFRHTMVAYNDTLVLFGGEVANGTLLNDLWMFNISSTIWKRMEARNNTPGVASHCASVVDSKIIIFGGQTQEYGFSHGMYTYDLVLQNGWKTIIYNLVKISDIRLVGHTCVFYPPLRSLLIFGGYKIISGRQSSKVDKLLMYHVDGKVWLPIVAADSPKPTAYHSSVIIGDYMVTYGGVIHAHFKDETCYGNYIYLFNLKNFTWLSILPTDSIHNASNTRGRYYHVVTAFKENNVLITGGFSGIANGDSVAFKIPSNVVNSDPKSTHMCYKFSQCVSCLTWGSLRDLLCGWCVQDSTCYPRESPSGPCSPTQTTRGWWGEKGSFLTSVDQCRIHDTPPGLISNVFFGNVLDEVQLVNPLKETTLYTTPRRTLYPNSITIQVRLFGYIYPFLSQSVDKPVGLILRIAEIATSLHLSTDESEKNTEKVISTNSKEGELKLSAEAERKYFKALFPNAAKNKMYYLVVKGEINPSAKKPYLEVLNASSYDVIDGRFVRPFFSDDCGQHKTCLECLSDMSCGWCSSKNICMRRNSSMRCQHSSGEDNYLVLNSTYCETCAQYIDCQSCFKDEQCKWNKKTHQCCHKIENCESENSCYIPCTSRKDCKSCALTANCVWCENQDKCLPWTAIPACFITGKCSHWSDISTAFGKCSKCSEKSVCEDCRKTRSCGWCGEFHNGSCVSGEFNAPDNGTCNQLLSPKGTTNKKSNEWSYGECPDENECITKGDCDKNADCIDTLGSYRCECRDGYEGDGKFCKALCNPRCVHGSCDKHSFNETLDRCDCNLGWTGSVCSLNCGCNNLSKCSTGIGVCDNCQGLTRGDNCELCVPGAYEKAAPSAGCTKCQCHGHGDEQRGICNNKTGSCFCVNNTMGHQCDQCLPGFFGGPRSGEGCYYPCKGHSILSNLTQGTLSSLPEPGQKYDPKNMNCVWIITTLTHTSNQVVYSDDTAAGTITFQMKDIMLDCQTDHIFIYDGMLNFKLGAIHSSSNLIGSLCGTDPSVISTIESRSGTLVVVFKGNVAQNDFRSGFNASFGVNQCPNSCTGNRYCHSNGTHESCICKPGWTGPACDVVKCPMNCSENVGQGHCDQLSGQCVCKKSFIGPSCNIQRPDDFLWKLISDATGSSPAALERMGHTMVADDQTESLLIYGGYSLYLGVLGDVWKYNTKTKNYVHDNSWSTSPSPRYFHAADVYKRTMYISGGITEKEYSTEVWKYHLDTKHWEPGQVLPRELAGHTMNIINDTLYLIGGYSYQKQCSSVVYTLSLNTVNSMWSDMNPKGDLLQVCFGHTSVYDHRTKSLVVFGKQATKMKPTLAFLNLVSNEWVVKEDVPQAYLRYFHVSMVVADVMVVRTGYTGYDIQDFADEPLVYDLVCGSWHKPDKEGAVPLVLAHSKVASINDVSYIFGGYNGLSSDKLFHQNMTSNWCAMFSTETSCNEVRNCVWCKDTASNLTACYISNTHSHLNCGNASNICENDAFMRMPRAAALTSPGDLCFGKSGPGMCSSCIQDKTSTCSWSVDSNLCFSQSFQPITCAFGLCGRMLRDYDVCPPPCNNRSRYCYDCLEQYNCGWCTDEAGNGHGVCTEGTLQGPYNGTCVGGNGPNGVLATWVSSVCLPENECTNGHHQCNENETCVDLDVLYKCDCLPKYERINGTCTPICSQGCVNGTCIDPDNCLCDFGWVGSNCSTECQCNKKGQCVDLDKLDQCQNCRNYTTGTSCDRCLPGFVGKDGECTSCNKICNYNAEICYTADEGNQTESTIYGPKDDSNLKCECTGMSEGYKCKDCKIGYYKSAFKCTKCKCRGHAATCDNRGLHCKCKNNTRTPIESDAGRQCSQCVSPYLGSPDIEGQQCYRDMKILVYRWFTREHSKYSKLLPRQTSFYYIVPSYTNIDIRLVIDISYGSLDVYISNGDNAFKVDANQNVSLSLTKVTSPESYCDGLNTYTTFSGDRQVVVFKQVQHRLVVTFPSDHHGLDKMKFYIIVKAGADGADGIIYFKQDTAKINLIVFFIVFACCFVFLLLGASIMWSIKHHIHSRQLVHDRKVENERLHNRPFAQFAFLFEYQSPSPSVMRHRKTTASTRKAIRPLGVQSTSDYHAAVTTVIFQMPKTDKTKMTVALGTTLALVTPQQMDKLAQSKSKETLEDGIASL